MRNGFLVCFVFLVLVGVGFGDGGEWHCWPYDASFSGLRSFCESWLQWSDPWQNPWADITGDGWVDMRDFGVLSSTWGGCGGDAGVAAREGYRRVAEILERVEIPGDTPASVKYNFMIAQVISKIELGENNPTILDSSAGKSFYIEMVPDPADPSNQFYLAVTGVAGQLEMTIHVMYTFDARQDTVFDYGIASRGPLQISGNIRIDGRNISVESDVYIVSANSNDALSIIGNSQIGGEVFIVNPDAEVVLEGPMAGIGGEYSDAAIANHVFKGVETVEFPFPNADHFEQYVGDTTIDSDTDLRKISTLDNVRIAAGTNPYFSSNMQINGVLFIEAPNVVTFMWDLDITGVIVGDGDLSDDSGMNQIIFLGSISSSSVSELPRDSQFDGLREEAGTFLIAPGFRASFGGSFDILHGAIAANALNFFGNAGGTIAGSLINYSDTPMVISCNSEITFNRSGITEVPAGFMPGIILHRDDMSYCEICRVP